MTEPDFWEKKFVLGFWDQKTPKWTKNEVFLGYEKSKIYHNLMEDFCLNLQLHKVLKLTQMIYFGKNHVFGPKGSNMGQQWRFSFTEIYEKSILTFLIFCINLQKEVSLKLVSAIFYQILFFHQMIGLQKLWKMFFI